MATCAQALKLAKQCLQAGYFELHTVDVIADQ